MAKSLEINQEVVDWFLSRIILSKNNDCWFWDSDDKAVPLFKVKTNTFYAKDVSYFIKTSGKYVPKLIGRICEDSKCLNPSHLFDRRKEKICYKCKKLLPIELFGIRYIGSNPRGECKECGKSERKIWSRNNPDKVRESNRRSGIKRQGMRILIPEIEELRSRQNFKCAICGKQELEGAKGSKKLFVDHNHSNGKVRGMLCIHCNHGLGNFKDNSSLLEKAIEYLKLNN